MRIEVYQGYGLDDDIDGFPQCYYWAIDTGGWSLQANRPYRRRRDAVRGAIRALNKLNGVPAVEIEYV